MTAKQIYDKVFCDKCHTLYIPGERHGCVSTEETGCSFCSNPAVIVDGAGKSSCANCAAEAVKAENDFKSKEAEKKGRPVKKGFDVNKPHHSEAPAAFKICSAGNCNKYADKAVHNPDGSFSFFCGEHHPNGKKTLKLCMAANCNERSHVWFRDGKATEDYCEHHAKEWLEAIEKNSMKKEMVIGLYCTKCQRVVTTYVKDGATKCYSCAGTCLIAADSIKELIEVASTKVSDDVNEAVNHPKHYNAHPSGVECITVTEHMTFNLGNATKYIWRCGEKGNIIQDLEKAIWYVNREIDKIKREKLAK